MLATAGLTWSTRTRSMPAMMPLVAPLPEQSSTRTPRSEAPLATPYVAPPIVPATWVPWPLQSWPLPPNASYDVGGAAAGVGVGGRDAGVDDVRAHAGARPASYV